MEDRELVAIMAAIIYTSHKDVFTSSVESSVKMAQEILEEVELPSKRRAEAKQKLEETKARQVEHWWDYVEGKKK
jgi:hypothetical protein